MTLILIFHLENKKRKAGVIDYIQYMIETCFYG